MKKSLKAQLSAILFGLSVASPGVMLHAVAQQPAADAKALPAESMRVEISKPLMAAKALFDENKIADALATLAETDSVKDKTPYEIFAVERSRGDYYLKSGDKAKAARSFEAVEGTNYLRKPEQMSLMQIIGQLYFQASNYPLAISWTQRYISEGGPDARAKDILNKSYFLNKDYAKALPGFNAYVQSELDAGRLPEEQYFQLILNCENALNDKGAILKSVELMATYYPSVQHWNYLISQIHSTPGFSDRLYLDIYRFRQELSLIKTAPEFLEMAELSTRAGLPAETKKTLERGFAEHVLDSGPDAKKHSAMLDSATKKAADDLKTMQQGEVSAAKSKDGTGLVNLGMAYATAGQFDKGASLIQEGINKGGVSRLEEAKLHLGVVYYWAGRKDDALKQLKTVAGTDGSALLARYWVMQINHPLVAK